MLGKALFWSFQSINTLSSVSMVLSPRRFHESLFNEPKRAYQLLGFSSTAIEMLHNVIRGQGAALLAASSYLYVQGPQETKSFLLIALVCGLTAFAHTLTLQHHRSDETVMKAIGSVSPLYGLISLNLVIGGIAAYLYATTS